MEDSKSMKDSCGKTAYENGHRRHNRLSRSGMRAVLQILIAGVATLGLTSGCFSPGDSSSSPQVKGDQWRLSIKDFQEGKARHFHYRLADNTTVRFFLIKTSDGTFRAALDACDVCWPQGKGYVQDGNYMVCKNCGRTFRNQDIGLYRGGCNPHPLQSRLEGKELVIELKELQEGARYFRSTNQVY
ncbi:MAG: DUF2318 domain-containing protein [bacterium]